MIHYLRRRVSQFIYWQWIKLSKLSAELYWWIHERINGKDGGD